MYLHSSFYFITFQKILAASSPLSPVHFIPTQQLKLFLSGSDLIRASLNAVKAHSLLSNAYSQAVADPQSSAKDASLDVLVIRHLMKIMVDPGEEGGNTCSHGYFEPICTDWRKLGHRFPTEF